jgi:hypothetical protein
VQRNKDWVAEVCDIGDDVQVSGRSQTPSVYVVLFM